ncbi:MAG: hypothetical protein OQK82_08740, partial [Candidatus Pacearchaeota archaeon]|nr:hypothetical protein [Candidatus Pacearchaeota archaeon]
NLQVFLQGPQGVRCPKKKPFENLAYPEERRLSLENQVKKLSATTQYSFEYLERAIEKVLRGNF